MAVDASVVVPTYNAGAKVDALLSSLRAQTLPADRFEVVAVDDGSSDDTWERLLAARPTMPNLHLERIPPSGWSGRPRNVGTDRAQGRYVFYCDHDDELFPHALEQMVETADRTSADVVVGKEVRFGAPTIGWEAFLADRDRADVLEDDVLAMLSPHKLFRTDFLRRHRIRFPEGRRRLEDHVFLAQAYTRTDRIAVLASEPCYRWIIYPDGSNSSEDLGDPQVYYASLENVFAVLREAEVPADRRDRLVQFWYATRMLKRLSPLWFDKWSAEYRDAAIEQMEDLAARLPQHLDEGLEPVLARRARLLRSRDRAALVSLADEERGTRLDVERCDITWDDGRLSVAVAGTLVGADDRPVVLVETADGALRLDVGDPVDVRPFVDTSSVHLATRLYGVGTEWYAPESLAFRTERVDGGHVLRVDGVFSLDPATCAFGRPLAPGTWSLVLRARVLGYASRPKLRQQGAGPAVVDGLAVLSTQGPAGGSTLAVGSTPGHLQAIGALCTVTPRDHGATVTVDLPALHVRDAAAAGLSVRIGDHDLPAMLVEGSPLRLVADVALPPGVHQVRLARGDAVGDVLAAVRVTSDGRHTAVVGQSRGGGLVSRVAARFTARR